MIRRILAMVPPGTEIVLSELTTARWDVKGFSKEECPEYLRRIVEQKIRLDEIDFEREILGVIGWEAPPGAWIHWPFVIAASRPE